MTIGKRIAAVGALTVVIALLVVLAGRPGRAQEPDAARVSDLKGRLAVHGADETAVSYLQRNGVVRDGDTLWTDKGGQAELELPRGGWVRLAEQTKIELLSIGRHPELRLWNGAVFCQLRPGFAGPLIVRGPDGDVELPAGCIARIEAQANGKSLVKVFQGMASVAPLAGERIQLRKGQRCALETGHLAGAVAAFDPLPPADGFDRYQTTRVGYLNRYREPEALRSLVGAYELAGRGDWVRHDGRDYWRPVQDEDWRPYSDGYWSYVEDEGPSWVDAEPWGYTTSHYGRWAFLPEYDDWGWEPDDDWEPAHVAWGGYGDDYIGWAPLGPDDPYVGWEGSPTRLSYWDGGAPQRRSWSFVRRDDFFYCRPAYVDRPVYLTSADPVFVRSERFRPVRDIYQDFGAPRYNVRGLTVDPEGYAARDTVLRVEQRLPRERYPVLQNRFRVAPDRDLRLARAVTPVEALQRFRGVRLAKADVLRGDPARRRYRGPERQARFLGRRGGRDRILLAAQDRALLTQAARPGIRARRPDRNAVRQNVAGRFAQRLATDPLRENRLQRRVDRRLQNFAATGPGADAGRAARLERQARLGRPVRGERPVRPQFGGNPRLALERNRGPQVPGWRDSAGNNRRLREARALRPDPARVAPGGIRPQRGAQNREATRQAARLGRPDRRMAAGSPRAVLNQANHRALRLPQNGMAAASGRPARPQVVRTEQGRGGNRRWMTQAARANAAVRPRGNAFGGRAQRPAAPRPVVQGFGNERRQQRFSYRPERRQPQNRIPQASFNAGGRQRVAGGWGGRRQYGAGMATPAAPRPQRQVQGWNGGERPRGGSWSRRQEIARPVQAAPQRQFQGWSGGGRPRGGGGWARRQPEVRSVPAPPQRQFPGGGGGRHQRGGDQPSRVQSGGGGGWRRGGQFGGGQAAPQRQSPAPGGPGAPGWGGGRGRRFR